MTRRLLLALFAALPACLPPAARAANGPQPDFKSDQEVFDTATKETVGTGNAQLTYGDLLLTADEIRYNTGTKIVTARGHAALTKGARRLLADTIIYHLADGTYTVGPLRMGEYPLYINGASASGDKRTLTVNDGQAMVHEPGAFVPTVRASRMFYTPGQKLQLEKGQIGLGDIQPVSFSLFQQNLNEPLISYVSLTGGYRATLGAFGEAGLHLPVTGDLKLGADLGLYTARGLMFGPSGSYQGSSDDGDYRGFFRSGFISDHGSRGTDILGQPVPRSRGYVTWEHQQQITEGLTLTGEFNYWKDSEILRDFRPQDFFAVQQPDSFLESVYTGHNYLVSLFARFQPNRFEPVQQRLPELRFDLLPLAVGNGFYERFNASAAVLRDDPPAGGPVLTSTRYDAYYGLSRVFAPEPWLSFTPVAGGRLTYYDQATGGRSTYTRTLGEVGFDAALRTSATYDYKNETWKIDGLRHLFVPRLIYRYIPEAAKGQPYIPPIDTATFSTYLPPLDLGDLRNIDALHATNTLRLEFDNTLQTRDPRYGSRDLVMLNVAADFLFRRDPGVRPVSEVHTELAVMPARWMQLDVYQTFAPQNFTLGELNTGLTLHDGEEWSVRFSSNFLRRQLNDYLIDSHVRLNEAYEATVRLQYDARQQRFDEQSYGIRQKLSNLWRAEYTITLYDGPRRESRFGFNVQVEVINF